MPNRKKPMGLEWDKLTDRWHNAAHEEKLKLAHEYGVTYDSMKHWISEGKTDKQTSACPTSPTVLEPRVTIPLQIQTETAMATVVILGDFHNPYQDNQTLSIVESFLAEKQPEYLIYNGDVNDFYQVSVFAKDPSRQGSLQKDIDVTTDMFERHNTIMPNTKKILVAGTHENRWLKYLQQSAPAVSVLNSTSISELYRLPKFGIQYVPYEQGILINGIFLVLHGTLVSAHSSYTAKRQYEKNGGCGICNHTHRGGSYYKKDRFGTWGWWENFCLCRLDPDWIQNPDWVQGFSLVHFNRTKKFWVEQIPIIDNKFIYGGKIYGG